MGAPDYPKIKICIFFLVEVEISRCIKGDFPHGNKKCPLFSLKKGQVLGMMGGRLISSLQ